MGMLKGCLDDFDTMNPRSFPSLNAKKDFFGLSEIPYL